MEIGKLIFLEDTGINNILEMDRKERSKSGFGVTIGFKHRDCDIIFIPSSEEGCIYAVTQTDTNKDVFKNCHIDLEFRNALVKHYGDEQLLVLKRDLAECDLDFANGNVTGDAPVYDVLHLDARPELEQRYGHG
ncbi:hypothetical protein REH81_03990 [Vibrio rotiferianus]